MLSPRPFVTARVNRRQTSLLKIDNNRTLIYKRSASRGQRSVIWFYPWFLTHQVAQLIMQCLVTRSVLPALFRHNPGPILTAIYSLQNQKLANLFVADFMAIPHYDLLYAFRVLAALTSEHGFDSTKFIMFTFWGHLQNRYSLTKSMCRPFLKDTGALDIKRFSVALAELDKEWSDFWSTRINKHCIFCGKNLADMPGQHLTRQSFSRILPCCHAAACCSCHDDFICQKGFKNCPECTSPYFSKNLDFECDTLASAIFRNQVMAANNCARGRGLVLDRDGHFNIGTVEHMHRVRERYFIYFTPQYYASQPPLFSS